MTDNGEEMEDDSTVLQSKEGDDQSKGSTDDVPEEMTEQIEASFGPMSVYVSGTNTESVKDTFEDVWETMMETSKTMREMKDDDEDSGTTGRTFGD